MYENNKIDDQVPVKTNEKYLHSILNILESNLDEYNRLILEFGRKNDILLGSEPESDPSKDEVVSENGIIDSLQRRLQYFRNLNNNLENQIEKLDKVV